MTRASLVTMLTIALGVAPVAFADEPVIQQTREPKNDKEDVSKIGDRDVDGSVNFYSIEKELKVGRQLAQQIEQNSKIITDPVVAEYVNRVGQNIVRNSDAQVPFQIKVIDAEEVNAFALPGGFFYVNSGLIKLAETESELAGVMAHEIAHVTARHGTRQATKGQIANLASIPLAIFLPGGWLGYGIYQAANFAIPMTFLKFSRGAEKQADFLGLQYLYKSGYDPTSMVTFFERIQAQKKRKDGAFAKAFASHPPTGKRIRLIQETMGEILPAKPEYVINTHEFDQVQERLVRLTSGTRTEETDPDRPTLKRRPDNEIETGGGVEDEGPPTLKRGGSDEDQTSDDSEDDDLPTLKRQRVISQSAGDDSGS